MCWGVHFICKEPGSTSKVTWHQDGALWPFSPSTGLSIWIALDEVTMQNGAMQFFSGSHQQGGLPIVNCSEDLDDVNGNRIVDSEMDRIRVEHPVVDVELAAGDCSIHSELLVHGSLPNESPNRRLAVTISYLRPESKDLGMGWNKRYGIHVSGGDPSGHWANLERPQGRTF